MFAFPSPSHHADKGPNERAARAAQLVHALERLLVDTQMVLADIAADTPAAGRHAAELRGLRDETRRLLAELEGLVPPGDRPESSAA